jgi:predicted DNA-binding transcriptional regulator
VQVQRTAFIPKLSGLTFMSMNPLIDSLMLKMRHNRVYTAVTFARLFGVSEKTVEAALATLIDAGKVRTCANARRDVGYCLTGTTPMSSSTVLSEATTVATPRLIRRVDGPLTGYDRELDAHRSLAMLVRR